ncbi:MAG TPA: NAD(P)/FAD-dependent oxidoreductase [Candidatus Dormibacteraeota bacterium]|nr:NAD(P)/FAD-dependent oxidoreductase [Candidatus Dormibacteraeota bacterium]
MSYDVVVAGGSFAGLVTATALRGRVALIEKGEIGDGQTSACGTTLDAVQKLGLEESIEEVHDEGVMHLRGGVVRFRLPYRFCTFDYRTFCRLLMERFDGDVVRAAASGVRTDGRTAVVATDGPAVEARLAVDATGWRATLAKSVQPAFPARAQVTYGLEMPATGWDDPGLHFYFDPRVRAEGYGWSFPAGPVARAGVLSYVAPEGVKASTDDFLAAEGLRGSRYHGGYLTAGLRPATAGPVFLVGDSAGHCLPLTGEGIRPAIFFAQQLSSLLNQVIGGRRTRFEAAAAYTALQQEHARKYRILRGAQVGLRGWPDPPMGSFFRTYAAEGALYRWLSRAYWDIAAPLLPAAAVPARGAVVAMS